MDKSLDSQIRAALFLWLSERFARNGGIFTRVELEREFFFEGKVVTLIGASGIWFPKGFDIPISITTTTKGLYPDKYENNMLRYSYQGDDFRNRFNVGLRKAFESKIPLVYFRAVVPGKYEALWPMIIKRDNPNELCIEADLAQVYVNEQFKTLEVSEVIDREYANATVKTRLHQPAFRFQVLKAYNDTCTLCGLKHPELLDAAHIIADSDPDGKPEVPNGLSLCKIHHVSYDKKIIGITPDYEIKVSDKVMKEKDGPMLTYGLQSMNGRKLILPSKKSDNPDRDKLKRRWDEFLEFAG